jgi:hypothetical protein
MKRRMPAVAISIAVSLAVGFLCGFFFGYRYAAKTIVCEIPVGFFQPRDIGVSEDLPPSGASLD